MSHLEKLYGISEARVSLSEGFPAEVHHAHAAEGHRLSARAYDASAKAHRSGNAWDHEKASTLHDNAAAHWGGGNSDHAEHMADEHTGHSIRHAGEAKDRIHNTVKTPPPK